jgi:hypothetical protein
VRRRGLRLAAHAQHGLCPGPAAGLAAGHHETTGQDVRVCLESAARQAAPLPGVPTQPSKGRPAGVGQDQQKEEEDGARADGGSFVVPRVDCSGSSPVQMPWIPRSSRPSRINALFRFCGLLQWARKKDPGMPRKFGPLEITRKDKPQLKNFILPFLE